MALVQDINYTALSWVQGELQTTLTTAAKDLTRYTNQSDSDSMAHCIAQLHQTVGILDMLHLSGASTLAAEMQALASALHDNQCKDPETAQELLMQSLILLPNYLKQLSKTREDHPLHIIDTINALRALHGQPNIAPYSLFQPILSMPLPAYVAPHPATLISQQDLQQENLHQTFQKLLLDWIRDSHSGNLIQLSQIIHRLRLNSAEEPTIRLWWAAEGVIESLLANGLTANNDAKLLLGELRQPLTLQVKQSELHLLNNFPDDLLKDLLFLVAQSTSETEHTLALKEAFSLHFFNQEQHHQIYNLSADALLQARKTLYDEIQHSKEFVGQLEQKTPHNTNELLRLAQQLSDMANTLHLLGENESEALLQTESNTVNAAARTESDLNRYQLLSLANALLQTEASVQPSIHSIARSDNISTEQEHLEHDVLKECLVEMVSVKDILSTLDNDTAKDPTNLVITASHQLSTIASNLSMIGFSEPADLLAETATQLTDNIHALSPERMRLFAESIAAGELFMEGLLQHGQPLELIIQQSQKNLAQIDALSTTLDTTTKVPPTDTSVTRHLARTTQEEVAQQEDVSKETSVTRYIAQAGIDTLSSVARYIAQQNQPPAIIESSIIPAMAIPDELAQETMAVEADAPTEEITEIDDEIASLFAEEASEISREFHNLIPTWREQQDVDALISIRRYFHTLKGSGRMAKADAISELAWGIENMLNRVLDGVQPPSSNIEHIVVDAHALLPELIYRFNQRQLDGTPAVNDIHQRILSVIESSLDENLPLEDELQLIFNHEATQHIANLQNEAEKVDEGVFTVGKGILRAAHSLKGCAAIANITPVATLALKLEQTLRQLYEQQRPLDEKRSTLLQAILVDVKDVIDQVDDTATDASTLDIDFIEDKIARLLPADIRYIDEQSADKEAFDPEILAVFLEESDELLADYITQATHWFHEPTTERRNTLHDKLQALEEGAEIAGIASMRTLYHQIDTLILQGDTRNPRLYELLDEGHQQLHNQVESLINNYPRPSFDTFSAQVTRFLSDIVSEQVDAPTPIPAPTLSVPATEESELLDAFTEEAGELLNASADAIKRWEQDAFDNAAQTQLQRGLHTLKGSSRMIDVAAIANLSHHMETLVLAGVEDNHALDANFFSLLHLCQDRLVDMQAQLNQHQPLTPANDLQVDIARFVSPDSPVPIEKTNNIISLPTVDIPSKTILEQEFVSHPDTPDEIILPPPTETAPAAIEQIRVRSDLLDDLSNFAGEVSISRDRASQQNIAAQQQIAELDETVSRLQEQLRSLEIETEAQILFRYEDTASGMQTEFDPLELDRFSMIQQLSRSLTESVSDLNDIRHSMSMLSRETEDVLLQQSRVNTELQQGLMNTRLLPFSGLVARLDRIVRQTSNELNKPTELTVIGAEKELDRTVLNRILAPIEHLLRNAIAHGIESEAQRQTAGKPTLGHIQLTIEHEGPEVVLTLADDGQGIDLGSVRQKAIEQQLISEEETLSDEDLTQLILSPGFSTADDISQLSGRGVGMDVVNNEIRALKGRLAIHSTPGQGTIFSIHLPLRLSIVQALIISAHAQQYAIPLSNIHTVVQPNKSQLESLLSAKNTTFEYAEENYQFFDLNSLLKQKQALEEQDVTPSLLLCRTRSIRFALLVDGVHGNREIVVKPLSTQLNSIHAINGATILGDGQIIFILDLLALIEHAPESIHYTTDAGERVLIDSPTDTPEIVTADSVDNRIAMVVDDSITMRKATGNLLKRNGFTVITARDGLEAVALLHEKTPDIILLDIEMPRMDGYEFATHVRHDSQFKELPIIMITSRDGEKHRERAMEIGVNGYIGKPYQEEQLLKEIEKHIGDTSHD